MNFCDGWAACRALNPAAQIIWDGLAMPDEVAACSFELWFWHQNRQDEGIELCEGLTLDIVVGGGEEVDLSWVSKIICTY